MCSHINAEISVNRPLVSTMWQTGNKRILAPYSAARFTLPAWYADNEHFARIAAATQAATIAKESNSPEMVTNTRGVSHTGPPAAVFFVCRGI